MPDSLLLPSAVRAALEHIVDYAGLFPPAALPLDEAAAEYARQRHGGHAWMLGRFVVPARRIGELETLLEARHESDPFALVTLFDGASVVEATPHTRPEACEVALRAQECELGAARTAIHALRRVAEERAPGLPVAVELARGTSAAALAEAMETLAECGFAAKLRCGGVTQEATPSVHEVADFILAALRAGVAFKATAGLHHPVRGFNAEAGFAMHGFLNVLAAATFAPSLDDAATLREILADEDAANFSLGANGFAWRGAFTADASSVEEVRTRRFLGFGSCSFSDPVDDLIALGVLTRE